MAKAQDISREMDKKTSPGRTTLSKVAAIALLGTSLAYFANLLLVLIAAHMFIPPLLILGVVTMLGAALSFLRFRWAPAVGAVVALGAISVQMSVPINQYFITHPSDAASFITLIIILSFGLVAMIAGIVATLQNYLNPAAPAPGNLRLLLTSFTTFVVGMLIVSALAAANPATSSASSSSSEPTVHMSADSFAQNVVLVSKGSRLLIVDDTSVEHILQNGMWTNTTPRTITEPGAPVVNNVDITGGSVQIGPFNMVGNYHIYCTIHQGMNLTIVVQ
jgi:plastocyanin